MRLTTGILAGVAALLVITGCAGTDDRTPAACLDGADAYLAALRSAPEEVKLAGRVPLADCLPEAQKGGDLATVGAAMVKAATQLNAEARAEPGGAANLQLGYLLGATEGRAERTDGIHRELLRRLMVAACYTPRGHPLPRAFTRTYRRGQRAGRRTG